MARNWKVFALNICCFHVSFTAGGVLVLKWHHHSIPPTPISYEWSNDINRLSVTVFVYFVKMWIRPLGGVLDRKWRRRSIPRPRFPINGPLTFCVCLWWFSCTLWKCKFDRWVASQTRNDVTVRLTDPDFLWVVLWQFSCIFIRSKVENTFWFLKGKVPSGGIFVKIAPIDWIFDIVFTLRHIPLAEQRQSSYCLYESVVSLKSFNNNSPKSRLQLFDF
jgi:hypothetical protein